MLVILPFFSFFDYVLCRFCGANQHLFIVGVETGELESMAQGGVRLD